MTIRRKHINILLPLLLVAAMFIVSAQERPNIPIEEPVEIDYLASRKFADTLHAAYMDTAYNVIADSSHRMKQFYEKLQGLKDGAVDKVSILHIGDSHIQAGYLTGRIRELIQDEFGNAGRGLVVPYRLAGMNEPRDYGIKSRYKITTTKATDTGPGINTGSSTVKIDSRTPAFEFSIWSKEQFDVITILHHQQAPLPRIPDDMDAGIHCTSVDGENHTTLILSTHTDSLKINGYVDGAYDKPEFYGFVLENSKRGVLYNELGLNGITFDHYLKATGAQSGSMNVLEPDLIIISLGTNSCYGNNFREEVFEKMASRFLEQVTEAYPESIVMVTTPMESCRRRTVRGRRTYEPNANIPVAGTILKGVAASMELPVWDLYNASGGKGSNQLWHGLKLMSNDRIHLTESGYRLQAEMFYDALVKGYNSSQGK